MKAFLFACVCAAVIAVVAGGVLNIFQKPVSEAYAAPTSVRL